MSCKYKKKFWFCILDLLFELNLQRVRKINCIKIMHFWLADVNNIINFEVFIVKLEK